MAAQFVASLTAEANMLHLDETFVSEATFSGDLTFTDTWEELTAVDGWLTGGPYGSQHINWVWGPYKTNVYAYGANFLMNGTRFNDYKGDYSYFIFITWDYSNASDITLTGNKPDVGLGSNVNFTDLSVSGSLSAIPDAGSSVALPGGVFVMLGALRQKTNI